MKIISEITNKEYKSVDECLAAEKLFNEQKAAEEERIKALREARDARTVEVEDAFAKANKLLEAYIKDYGSFCSTRSNKLPWFSLSGLFGL